MEGMIIEENQGSHKRDARCKVVEIEIKDLQMYVVHRSSVRGF